MSACLLYQLFIPCLEWFTTGYKCVQSADEEDAQHVYVIRFLSSTCIFTNITHCGRINTQPCFHPVRKVAQAGRSDLLVSEIGRRRQRICRLPEPRKWFIFSQQTTIHGDRLHQVCRRVQHPQPSERKYAWQAQSSSSLGVLRTHYSTILACTKHRLNCFKNFHQSSERSVRRNTHHDKHISAV